MSGSGNDFIVIDARERPLDPSTLSDFIAKVCRRGLSVGADGVILVDRSDKADYAWHFYNADGGEAAMCGNGLRCVARFAYENKIAQACQTIATQAGIMRAEILDKGAVRVQLTHPANLKLHIKIDMGSEIREGHFVNTGVPHVVYIMDNLDAVDVVKLGRATRYHPLFAPAGTNANFVSRINRNEMRIRTYERGVEDETLACGTGSVAAAVILSALGEAESPIQMRTRGGTVLGVQFADGYHDLFLTGDARIIYKGELSEEALL